MAQSIVALEQSLKTANQRLAEAESQSSRGSLMPGAVPRVGPSGPDQAAPAEAPPQGPGFLAGAFQTALAVAGGTLLGNSIGSIFGADKAKASEARRDERSQADDEGEDDNGDHDDDEEHEGGGFLDSIFGGGDED